MKWVNNKWKILETYQHLPSDTWNQPEKMLWRIFKLIPNTCEPLQDAKSYLDIPGARWYLEKKNYFYNFWPVWNYLHETLQTVVLE